MQVSQINNYGNHYSFKSVEFFEPKKWNQELLNKIKQHTEIQKLADLFFNKEKTDIEVHRSLPEGVLYIYDMNELSPKGNNLICTIKDLNKFSAEEAYKKYMGV